MVTKSHESSTVVNFDFTGSLVIMRRFGREAAPVGPAMRRGEAVSGRSVPNASFAAEPMSECFQASACFSV